MRNFLWTLLVVLSSTICHAQLQEFSKSNVRWYGTKGDGVTDDTAALQRAFDSGYNVFIPPGKYRFTSPIVVNKRITITGAGFLEDETAQGTTVLLKDGNFDGIRFNGGAVVMEKLVISATNDIAGDGIVAATPQVVLRDVSVLKQGGNGIRVGIKVLNQLGNANFWRFANVTCRSNSGWGIYCHDLSINGPNANGGLATGLFLFGNVLGGLYLDRSQVNTWSGVDSEVNPGYGIYITGDATHNSFLGYHTEANATNIYCNTNTFNNMFMSADNSIVLDDGYNMFAKNAGGLNQLMYFSRPIVSGVSGNNRRQLSSYIGLEGHTPGFVAWNTAANADERLWDFVLSGSSFYLEASNDAATTNNPVFAARRTGAVVTSFDVSPDFRLSGNAYVGGTVNRRQLGSHITLEGATPGFVMWNTSASANEKMWNFVSGGGTFKLQCMSDNAATYTDVMQFTRSASTATGVYFVPPVDLSTNLTVHGTFTATNFVLSAVTAWNLGTVTNGGTVTTPSTLSVPGAQPGDPSIATHTSITNSGWFFSAVVTAVDKVSVTALNMTGGDLTPIAGNVVVKVFKQ